MFCRISWVDTYSQAIHKVIKTMGLNKVFDKEVDKWSSIFYMLGFCVVTSLLPLCEKFQRVGFYPCSRIHVQSSLWPCGDVVFGGNYLLLRPGAFQGVRVTAQGERPRGPALEKYFENMGRMVYKFLFDSRSQWNPWLEAATTSLTQRPAGNSAKRPRVALAVQQTAGSHTEAARPLAEGQILLF